MTRGYREKVRLGLFAVVLTMLAGCSGRAPDVDVSPAPATLSVTSTAFADGQDIPPKYTCDGQGVSPPLRFEGLPPATAEVALLVEDPDAPRGTFVHWLAWGIDPGSAGLAEGQAAPGSGRNDFGKNGYGGPCPPKGSSHRYVFTAYALADRLDLPNGASAADLKKAVSGRALAEGRLTGRYARQ
jgi:Raf kinase inhibitor-like YbhB/YbcL family protein